MSISEGHLCWNLRSRSPAVWQTHTHTRTHCKVIAANTQTAQGQKTVKAQISLSPVHTTYVLFWRVRSSVSRWMMGNLTNCNFSEKKKILCQSHRQSERLVLIQNLAMKTAIFNTACHPLYLVPRSTTENSNMYCILVRWLEVFKSNQTRLENVLRCSEGHS